MPTTRAMTADEALWLRRACRIDEPLPDLADWPVVVVMHGIVALLLSIVAVMALRLAGVHASAAYYAIWGVAAIYVALRAWDALFNQPFREARSDARDFADAAVQPVEEACFKVTGVKRFVRRTTGDPVWFVRIADGRVRFVEDLFAPEGSVPATPGDELRVVTFHDMDCELDRFAGKPFDVEELGEFCDGKPGLYGSKWTTIPWDEIDARFGPRKDAAG